MVWSCSRNLEPYLSALLRGGAKLTFFTTAKPFRGHSGIIQCNAIKSWALLSADVEVILFGDDEGAAEAARELGIRHEPHVERSEYGSKRLDYMFVTARAIARYEILSYVNCDIILMEDFCRALEQISTAQSKFLMVRRRWDVDINCLWDFAASNWQTRLRNVVLQRGRQRSAEWIDYFAFTRELYGASLPVFVIGRVHWDHWLVGKRWTPRSQSWTFPRQLWQCTRITITATTRKGSKAYGTTKRQAEITNSREVGNISG